MKKIEALVLAMTEEIDHRMDNLFQLQHDFMDELHADLREFTDRQNAKRAEFKTYFDQELGRLRNFIKEDEIDTPLQQLQQAATKQLPKATVPFTAPKPRLQPHVDLNAIARELDQNHVENMAKKA